MSFLRIDRRSLRVSLLARLGMVAIIVVGVTWFLHDMLMRDLARDFLGDRLRQEAHYTVERLKKIDGPPRSSLQPSALASEVFHHLYVLRIGDQEYTSDPSWLLPLEPFLNETSSELFDIHWQGSHSLFYRTRLELGGKTSTLLIGEDFSKVEKGLGALQWWIGGISGILLLLLITLNLFAVNRSFRSLFRLKHQLNEFQMGQRDRLEIEAPSELDDLISQLNRFMEEMQRRILRSRAAVADLSHTLQTPLAAVTQVLRGRRPIDDKRRELMLERLEGMQAQLKAELQRARFAGPSSAQRATVAEEAETLVDMMRTLYPEKCFHLNVLLPKETTVAIERHDLNEMLGIVLDNAGKWARKNVECHICMDKGLVIEIIDDGPGVEESALLQLGQRGKRLDESKPGYGLGLAILKQIVTQYNGEVAFSSSCNGGLSVSITLPRER
ncbi:MAG: integral membrane sensor signal transduction histidine kinase [Halomonadaceae bacterium T82-2]|nr:MAG: integral membrane sensor signal transduction histidine kinase [Halomonadaceae bacterium T82-2]